MPAACHIVDWLLLRCQFTGGAAAIAVFASVAFGVAVFLVLLYLIERRGWTPRWPK